MPSEPKADRDRAAGRPRERRRSRRSSPPVPRPAISEPTIVPWSLVVSPTGVWPSARAEARDSPFRRRRRPAGRRPLPSTPVSITATVTPAPLRRVPGLRECRSRRASTRRSRTASACAGPSAIERDGDSCRRASAADDRRTDPARAARSASVPVSDRARSRRTRRRSATSDPREREVADRVDAGPGGEGVRREGVQALDAHGHAAGRDSGDLVDDDDALAVGEVRLVGGAVRARSSSSCGEQCR